ncbi:hypothetical protein F2Q69_00006925 [Brassica cretica]|uniref:Uncharacterized protein n=1 Tax=Brassica cretica TaxID=69181 RepID=A0A8S9PD34_BRACR|nr:hypothetical protein F2Q69_00006925 [Brassica cretica]
MGSSPASEGVLTGSGGCSEGLGGDGCRSILASEYRSTLLLSIDSDIVRAGQMWVFCCELLPPEHIFSDLLDYADDPPGHASLHCCPEQVTKGQPLLAVQYLSMSEMECRSMSGKGYWLTEALCCRSIGVSENRLMGLVSGSTVVEHNRATQSCCCRSIGSALPYGSCVRNLQDLVRIAVEIPCCFWHCWACT